MMTPALCAEKAKMCEARASACAGTPHAADWLEIAVHWRGLAGDGTAQATVSRLMNANRARKG